MSDQEHGPEAPAQSTPASAPASASGRELTPAQLEQRRAAARKARGPRTAEGRAASRLNAFKHGLFASEAVNAKIDGRQRAAEFQLLLATFCDDLAPVGVLERMLVEEIAVCCWRLRRALRTECREAWDAEEKDRGGDPAIVAFAAALGQQAELDVMELRRQVLERADLDSLLIPPEGPAQSILRFEGSVEAHLHRALKMLIQLQDKRRAQNAVTAQSIGDGAGKNTPMQNETSVSS